MSDQIETPFQPFVPPAASEPPKRRGRPRNPANGTPKPKAQGCPAKAPLTTLPDVFPIGRFVEACAGLSGEEVQAFGAFANSWAGMTPETRGRIVVALDKLFSRK
jgi:hypothetical protein